MKKIVITIIMTLLFSNSVYSFDKNELIAKQWKKQQQNIKKLVSCLVHESSKSCYEDAIVEILDAESKLMVLGISPADNRIVSRAFNELKKHKNLQAATIYVMKLQLERLGYNGIK